MVYHPVIVIFKEVLSSSGSSSPTKLVPSITYLISKSLKLEDRREIFYIKLCIVKGGI
jgi:hypothetical protein